jgi:hypothetical protein
MVYSGIPRRPAAPARPLGHAHFGRRDRVVREGDAELGDRRLFDPLDGRGGQVQVCRQVGQGAAVGPSEDEHPLLAGVQAGASEGAEQLVPDLERAAGAWIRADAVRGGPASKSGRPAAPCVLW